MKEADRHVAAARRRRIAGAWSVAGAVSVPLEVCIGFTLCDFAAGAPAPMERPAEEREGLYTCFNYWLIMSNSPQLSPGKNRIEGPGKNRRKKEVKFTRFAKEFLIRVADIN